MKKLMLLSVIVLLLCSLCACTGKETPTAAAPTQEPAASEEPAAQEASGRPEAEQYEYTPTAEQTVVSGLLFSKDVTVSGGTGIVVFCDCEFKGNIILKGGEGTRIILNDDCVLSDATEGKILSTVTEATMASDLPKIMNFCSTVKVTLEGSGAVVAPLNLPIVLNGTTYKGEESEWFVNEVTGEFTEYSGQEAQYHNICSWTENGEPVLMAVAIYSE